MGKNYTGRYEKPGADWQMRSQQRGSDMFGLGAAKFWVAIIGFALQAVTAATGFDVSLIGITPEAVIAFLTAVGVWSVPNAKTT